MKISYLICSLLIVLAISHSFSLHPVLASLISFGVGIGYMNSFNGILSLNFEGIAKWIIDNSISSIREDKLNSIGL